MGLRSIRASVTAPGAVRSSGLKVVEYFTAFPFSQADLNKGLRVSRAGRTFRGSEPQRGLKLTVPLVAPGGGLRRVCGLRGQRGSRSWVP